MSDTWRTVSVEEIAAPIPNALATGPFGSSIGSKHFVSSGVPVIRGSNLSEDIGIRLNESGLVFITEEKASEFTRSIVKEGDLIFTCWGTVNQVGLIDGRSSYANYVISNKQMKLTPDKSTDPLFLYYVFSSPKYQQLIKSQAIGSSVPGFNLGQLRSIQLQLPPLSNQRTITNFLGTLDDKIELNRQMNRTLEQTAQALFKSWFVDFDPVVAKAAGKKPYGMIDEVAALFPDKFVDSEHGSIPEGWRAGPVTEIIAFNPRRKLDKGTNAPYLAMQNLSLDSSQPMDWIERPFSSGMCFRNGDTIMARITPCLENGKTAYINFLMPNQIGCGSTEYIVLRSKENIPSSFSYFLARSDDYRNHAIANMTGSSGRQRTPVNCFDSFSIPMAPAPIYIEYGRISDAVLEMTRANAAESKTLKDLRDTLLPKLLSGQIRIKQAEKIASEAV